MSEDYIISDNTKQLIDDVVKKFPNNQSRSAIIESLLILQHENNGFITKKIMKALAIYLTVHEIDIYEVATFYTMINVYPVGKNTIAV